MKPKPLTLRRERSNLTADHMPRTTADYKEYNAGTASGSAVNERCALVPPSTCIDENILRECLEELKRKRYALTLPVMHQ